VAAGLGDHLIGSVLRVGDDVIARDSNHRNALRGEVATERGQPGGDVLDVGAVVTDEGHDKRGTREVVEADRRAGGRLGQGERRRGGAEGEHGGLNCHARQRSCTTRTGHTTLQLGAQPCDQIDRDCQDNRAEEVGQ
jgi:hypothetical protein